MQQFERIITLLDRQESCIDTASLTRLLEKEEGSPPTERAVQDFLEQDVRATEVEPGRFYSTARLVNGICFFGLPEPGEIAEGKLSLFGGELFPFLKPAFGREHVELAAKKGVIRANFALEDSDFFLVRGLRDWYDEVGFKEGEDAVLFRIDDFYLARYTISRLGGRAFDKLMDSKKTLEMMDFTAALLEEQEKREPAEEVSIPVARLLQTMLYRKAFDFTVFPCNLSFYLSDGGKFVVSGNRVLFRSDVEEDFSPFYLGGNGEIPTELEEHDLGELEAALTRLFVDGEPKKAASVLKELKLKYPGERILNKFLYQAAYFLEQDEEILHHTREYMEDFPADPDPLRTRGEVFFRQGKLEEAGECFREALRLIHPQDKSFLAEVSTLWMYLKWEQGDEQGALQLAQQALKAEPDNEEVKEFLEETGKSVADLEAGAGGTVIEVDFSGKKDPRQQKNRATDPDNE